MGDMVGGGIEVAVSGSGGERGGQILNLDNKKKSADVPRAGGEQVGRGAEEAGRVCGGGKNVGTKARKTAGGEPGGSGGGGGGPCRTRERPRNAGEGGGLDGGDVRGIKVAVQESGGEKKAGDPGMGRRLRGGVGLAVGDARW